MFLGATIFLIGLIYFAEINLRMQGAEEDINRAEQAFLRDIKTDVVNKNLPVESPPEAALSETDAADAGDSAQKYKNAIGFLKISKLNLNLPIFPDTSRTSLTNGVGIVVGTDMPSGQKHTTAVIAGHRGGRNGRLSFRYIDRLSSGDEIKVVTAARQIVYRVIGSEVIEPTDWSKFKRFENKNLLILMACHPYPKNDKRLLIYAEST